MKENHVVGFAARESFSDSLTELLRIGRGTEYCGNAERHHYQLYLALNDIEHTKTKVKSAQTNGICKRFHRRILNEFYQITLGKKSYQTIETLQAEIDLWLVEL